VGKREGRRDGEIEQLRKREQEREEENRIRFTVFYKPCQLTIAVAKNGKNCAIFIVPRISAMQPPKVVLGLLRLLIYLIVLSISVLGLFLYLLFR
jgi:hypothetical protein